MITDRQRGHQPGAETEQLERTVLETRLQALQAQIEPHFLFNTFGQHRPDANRPAAAFLFS
jgi:hypothetical protein